MSAGQLSFGSTKQRGAALVLVLAMVVILAVLMAVFLSRLGGESARSALLADSEQSRQLAQRAVDEVIARISAATTQGANGSLSTRSTWASQPGMIRVFDSNGNFSTAHRLYSATDTEIASDLEATVAADVPADWASRMLDYVNLNAPTASGRYPILDPAAASMAQGLTVPTGAPMPVRWLYVQRDGSMGPNIGNDPVGRIAFWADDETCKVNINSASEGGVLNTIGGATVGFYDINRTGRNNAWGAGNRIRMVPLAGEFNMHPGHPATASLSSVFGSLGTPITQIQTYTDNSLASNWGGSQGARIVTFQDTTTADNAGEITVPTVPIKDDPLAADVSEWIFGNNTSVGSGTRDRSNSLAASNASPQNLSQADFLATTRNPSSTLNLFGTPRVSIWPLAENPDNRSNYDRRMALASTYGSTLFAFQRNNSKSATDGDIGRNFQILESLEDKLGTRFPGLGPSAAGTFSGKYGTNETRQILTNIFDLIRIANIDSPPPDEPWPADKQLTLLRPRTPFAQTARPFSGGSVSVAESGLVVPAEVSAWGTRGFGRVPTITEAVVQVFRMDDENTPPPADPLEPQPELKLGVVLYFEIALPAAGFPVTFPMVRHETGPASIGFQLPGLATPTAANFSFRSREITWRSGINGSNVSGGPQGVAPTLAESPNGIHNAAGGYQFFATLPAVPRPANAANLVCTGGTIEVVLAVGGASGVDYQDYEFVFPPFTAPMPKTAVRPTWRDGSTRILKVAGPSMALLTLEERFSSLEQGTYYYFNRLLLPEDVVRSLEPRDGDLRTIATMGSVDGSQFAPHADYNSGVRQAHSMRFVQGWQFTDAIQEPADPLGSVTISPNVSLPGKYFSDYQVQAEQPVSTFNFGFSNSGFDLPASFVAGLADSNPSWARDFDNTNKMDGPFLSKPVEWNYALNNSAHFFRFTSVAPDLFSPHFQMPSPVAFGTISSGAHGASQSANRNNSDAWRTLLFCPKPSGPESGIHIGLEAPADYVLLDLFEMPVVIPRAMSTPGSTEGRINLNQQIIPFTDIERTTGLHAALTGLRMALTPNPTDGIQRRDDINFFRLNVPETVRGIAKRWTANFDLYRSPAEICGEYLVPTGGTGDPTHETVSGTWWNGYRLTPDNMREQPYVRLYPLLTTQSNTYQIHIVAQTLGAGFRGGATQADGGERFVTGQWSGAITVERYLDPDDLETLDATLDLDATSLQPYHRFRTITVRPD